MSGASASRVAVARPGAGSLLPQGLPPNAAAPPILPALMLPQQKGHFTPKHHDPQEHLIAQGRGEAIKN